MCIYSCQRSVPYHYGAFIYLSAAAAFAVALPPRACCGCAGPRVARVGEGLFRCGRTHALTLALMRPRAHTHTDARLRAMGAQA